MKMMMKNQMKLRFFAIPVLAFSVDWRSWFFSAEWGPPYGLSEETVYIKWVCHPYVGSATALPDRNKQTYKL